MNERTPLAQMTAWDLVTLLIQIGVVITSIVLAVQGDTSALLGLGALAGGSRSNLLLDVFKATTKRKVPTKTIGLVVACCLLVGCSGAFGAQWVSESRSAVLESAQPYVEGCKEITVAPLFSVGWESADVAFGGGVLVGCSDHGQLLEFRCVMAVAPSGSHQWRCLPLATWEKMLGEVE